MVDIKVLVDVKTILGEGPLWDVDEQRLYWIDSFGMNVFRCTADGREVRAWDVPEKIGSLALRCNSVSGRLHGRKTPKWRRCQWSRPS